ncbi:hypothetical protein WK53_24105 [Burkholderia ubonensis]|uniref:Secreted protein n=1 Tax=Burkholderia ubonensis TaxID=101571 RepID=A0AAW3NN90_9BURK|nr:hypothetical protein WK53_24105 [Burkholderia ubonensis]
MTAASVTFALSAAERVHRVLFGIFLVPLPGIIAGSDPRAFHLSDCPDSRAHRYEPIEVKDLASTFDALALSQRIWRKGTCVTLSLRFTPRLLVVHVAR